MPITLRDAGTSPFAGSVPLRVVLSDDATLDAGDAVVAETSAAVNRRACGCQSLKIKFSAPETAPFGEARTLFVVIDPAAHTGDGVPSDNILTGRLVLARSPVQLR